MKKGGCLLVEETAPFGTLRDNEGLCPLTPEPFFLNDFQQPYESAVSAAQPRFLFSIRFSVYVRSAAAATMQNSRPELTEN